MTASNIHFNVIFSEIGENELSPVDFTASKSKPYQRNFNVTGAPGYPLDAMKLTKPESVVKPFGRCVVHPD